MHYIKLSRMNELENIVLWASRYNKTVFRVSARAPLGLLASESNFTCSKFRYDTFLINKGADQSERMRRLVYTIVVCQPLKTGFLVLKSIFKTNCIKCLLQYFDAVTTYNHRTI